MARTAVDITNVTLDAATNSPTGATIVAADGAIIDAGGDFENLAIRITHTAAAEYDATIVAPTDSPQAVRSSLGSLVVPFAAGNSTAVTKYIAVEGARFAQSDGSIHVDFESAFTGTIAALRLPSEN
ncbi:MAG TPA: hypothetical protein VIG24_19440 [Acidimicrobiia bacterium]